MSIIKNNKFKSFINDIFDLSISKSDRFKKYCLFIKNNKITSEEQEILKDIKENLYDEWEKYILKFPQLIIYDDFSDDTYDIVHIESLWKFIKKDDPPIYIELRETLKNYCKLYYNYIKLPSLISFIANQLNVCSDEEFNEVHYYPRLIDINLIIGDIYFVNKSGKLRKRKR